MPHDTDTIECSDCGQALAQTPAEQEARNSCPNCGSTKRTFSVSIISSATARDGVGIKAKRPGQKKPYIESVSMPTQSTRTGRMVHHERLIDRDNNQYQEKVTDYETGEVIHHQVEPLTDHVGHGSARAKRLPGEA